MNWAEIITFPPINVVHIHTYHKQVIETYRHLLDTRKRYIVEGDRRDRLFRIDGNVIDVDLALTTGLLGGGITNTNRQGLDLTQIEAFDITQRDRPLRPFVGLNGVLFGRILYRNAVVASICDND